MMIKIEGTTKQAEFIESKIKRKTLCLSVPFIASKNDGGQNAIGLGSGTKSRCFTRDYEIVASKEKLMEVKTKGQESLRNFLIWLTCEPINMTFRYDYRVDKCEISVPLYSWKRLLVLIPELKNDIRIIEPNKCQIIDREISQVG